MTKHKDKKEGKEIGKDERRREKLPLGRVTVTNDYMFQHLLPKFYSLLFKSSLKQVKRLWICLGKVCQVFKYKYGE